MSQCFRMLPGRLSSLIGGRKPLSKLDRCQLQKQIESSTFLKQFLGTQRALSVRANVTGKSLIPFADCILHSNLPLASLDTYSQWNEKIRRYDANENKNVTIYWIQNSNKHDKSQRLSVVLMKNRKHITPIGIIPDDVTVFQAQSVIRNNSFLDNNRIFSKGLYNSRESNINRNILFTSDDTSVLKTSSQLPLPQDNEGKPSQEQLQYVVDLLNQNLPNLFVKPQNYTMYTKDIIFINNFRGVTTKGLVSYAKQMILLRLIGHLKFAHVKLDIIKITMHTEDGTVKVRWRIRGVKGWRMIAMFWKIKIWKIKDVIESNHELWYDGFSIYYINADGKIYKHVADKVMPDQDVVAKKGDLNIAPKLAIFTGLAGVFDSVEDFFELNSNLKLHQN